jgi:hypothetical protein
MEYLIFIQKKLLTVNYLFQNIEIEKLDKNYLQILLIKFHLKLQENLFNS